MSVAELLAGLESGASAGRGYRNPWHYHARILLRSHRQARRRRTAGISRPPRLTADELEGGRRLISEAFCSHARLYDLMFPGGRPAVDFYRAGADRQGGRVLELGCGTGQKLIPIASVDRFFFCPRVPA